MKSLEDISLALSPVNLRAGVSAAPEEWDDPWHNKIWLYLKGGTDAKTCVRHTAWELLWCTVCNVVQGSVSFQENHHILLFTILSTYHSAHLYTLLGKPLDIFALTQICNQPIIWLQLIDAFGWWWRRAAEAFWMWWGCWCQAGWSAGLSQTTMVHIKIQWAAALQEKILVDVRGELELQFTQARQNWTTDDGTTFRDPMSLSLLQHLD